MVKISEEVKSKILSDNPEFKSDYLEKEWTDEGDFREFSVRELRFTVNLYNKLNIMDNMMLWYETFVNNYMTGVYEDDEGDFDELSKSFTLFCTRVYIEIDYDQWQYVERTDVVIEIRVYEDESEAYISSEDKEEFDLWRELDDEKPGSKGWGTELEKYIEQQESLNDKDLDVGI